MNRKFSMSMYGTKEDLYRDKANYFKAKAKRYEKALETIATSLDGETLGHAQAIAQEALDD